MFQQYTPALPSAPLPLPGSQLHRLPHPSHGPLRESLTHSHIDREVSHRVPRAASVSRASRAPVTARSLWSTEDELQFITFLGTWREPHRERAPLLRRYLAACAHRQDWGQIDVVQVQVLVERLLAEDDAATA